MSLRYWCSWHVYAHDISVYSYRGIFAPHSLAIPCGLLCSYWKTSLYCYERMPLQFHYESSFDLGPFSINSQTTLREPLVLALLDYDFQVKSMIKLTADSIVKPCTPGCELLESHTVCCCYFEFCSKFIKTHIGTV